MYFMYIHHVLFVFLIFLHKATEKLRKSTAFHSLLAHKVLYRRNVTINSIVESRHVKDFESVLPVESVGQHTPIAAKNELSLPLP